MVPSLGITFRDSISFSATSLRSYSLRLLLSCSSRRNLADLGLPSLRNLRANSTQQPSVVGKSFYFCSQRRTSIDLKSSGLTSRVNSTLSLTICQLRSKNSFFPSIPLAVDSYIAIAGTLCRIRVHISSLKYFSLARGIFLEMSSEVPSVEIDSKTLA